MRAVSKHDMSLWSNRIARDKKKIIVRLRSNKRARYNERYERKPKKFRETSYYNNTILCAYAYAFTFNIRRKFRPDSRHVVDIVQNNNFKEEEKFALNYIIFLPFRVLRKRV